MKILGATLILACMAAGCATTPKTKTVNIDSEPRGARVFVAFGADENGAKARDFIGVTPCQYQAELDGDGFKMPHAFIYSMAVPPVAVFICEPPSGATNLFEKRQIFHGGNLVLQKDKEPGGIFFDLTKPQ